MKLSNGFLVFIENTNCDSCNYINELTYNAHTSDTIQFARIMVSANDPMALHAIYALAQQISELDLRTLLDLPIHSIVSISNPTYMINEFAQNLVEFSTIGNINAHTFASSTYNPIIQDEQHKCEISTSTSDSNSDSDSDYNPAEEAISISSDSVISIANTESEISYNDSQQMEEFMEILHDPANRQQCIAYQHNFEELALVTGDNIEHIGETEICLLCHCRIIQGLHLVRQNFICPNIKCKTPRIYHLTCLLSWMLVRGRVPNCHICNHPDLRDD
jgi:hypothetical protein